MHSCLSTAGKRPHYPGGISLTSAVCFPDYYLHGGFAPGHGGFAFEHGVLLLGMEFCSWACSACFLCTFNSALYLWQYWQSELWTEHMHIVLVSFLPRCSIGHILLGSEVLLLGMFNFTPGHGLTWIWVGIFYAWGFARKNTFVGKVHPPIIHQSKGPTIELCMKWWIHDVSVAPGYAWLVSSSLWWLDVFRNNRWSIKSVDRWLKCLWWKGEANTTPLS